MVKLRQRRKYLATGLSVALVVGTLGLASASASSRYRRYIDAGNTAAPVTDHDRTWEPQTGFTGGTPATLDNSSVRGLNSNVAETVLTGASSFALDVPNGRYRVTLWVTGSQDDVTLCAEGKDTRLVHANQLSGNRLRTVTLSATVSDGELDISFTPTGNSLQIAALAIKGGFGTSTPTPMPAPTPSVPAPAPMPVPTTTGGMDGMDGGTTTPSTTPDTMPPMSMPDTTMPGMDHSGDTAFMNVGGPPVRNFMTDTADEYGEFQLECGLSHQAKDDPIVDPGVPGAAHMHNFYGNESTDAFSTTASLMASQSSCGRGFENTDHSAYWVPSLVKADGTPEKGGDPVIWLYYRRGGAGSGPAIQQTFPNGLHMIAGDHMATSPQPRGVVQWQCGFGGDLFDHIPNCNTEGNGDELHATIPFPNCWNGKDLDTPTHQGHVAYSAQNGACPAGFPVVLPSLWYEVDYIGITDGSQYTLASGGKYSMHGDFFAAWDLQAERALVDGCLNNPHVCEDVVRTGNTFSASGAKGTTIDITKF